MFLVVAILLATLTYQAILTPPGGVWQDNGVSLPQKQGVVIFNFLPSIKQPEVVIILKSFI